MCGIVDELGDQFPPNFAISAHFGAEEIVPARMAESLPQLVILAVSELKVCLDLGNRLLRRRTLPVFIPGSVGLRSGCFDADLIFKLRDAAREVSALGHASWMGLKRRGKSTYFWSKPGRRAAKRCITSSSVKLTPAKLAIMPPFSSHEKVLTRTSSQLITIFNKRQDDDGVCFDLRY